MVEVLLVDGITIFHMFDNSSVNNSNLTKRSKFDTFLHMLLIPSSQSNPKIITTFSTKMEKSLSEKRLSISNNDENPSIKSFINFNLYNQQKRTNKMNNPMDSKMILFLNLPANPIKFQDLVQLSPIFLFSQQQQCYKYQPSSPCLD